jgi:CRP-like cAMP-binding protein
MVHFRGIIFHVLLDGEADVEVDGKPRPALRAGSFFGEISMLDRGLVTATVVTRTPARLMVMSHAQFRDAIKADDNILSKVIGCGRRPPPPRFQRRNVTDQGAVLRPRTSSAWRQ